MVKISKILILVLIIGGMLGFNFGVAQEEIRKEKIPEIEKVIRPDVLKKAKQYPDEFQRVIIIFQKKPAGYRDFIQSIGGKIIHDFNIIDGVAISLPGRLIERLKELKNIISIQEDREVRAFLTESVPLINADDVWALGYNGSGKTVCVVDTGIDYTHPALGGCFGSGCKVVDGYDFVNNDSDPMDDHGHGTHCAGIVASEDSTYKGVAPGAKLMAVKVLNAQGSGYESDVIAGIEWCSNKSVDVISISLGGGLFSTYCDSEADAMAVNKAVEAGAVVSIASGNDGSLTKILAPACASKAISVGATYDANVGSKNWAPTCIDNTTAPDKIVCFTNRNKILDLLAPGAMIKSTVLNGQFATYAGTSMAAPHISGSAALLLQKNPNLRPDEIKDILKATGVSITDTGGTNLTFPRVNVLAAVQLTKKPKIKTIKVYDVTGLNTHTDTSNLINSGLSQIFKLEPGKTYRAEINVKNVGAVSWVLGLTDSAFHESLNSAWAISTSDIWYTIGVTDYTGGTWSGGKVSWNTSLGGEISSLQTAVFNYVFSVPANQAKITYNIHTYFKTDTRLSEDYSKYSFKPAVCFILYNKGSPDSTYEQLYINELENIGYLVEYNTPHCNYDGNDIKNKTADFTGYDFWAHSYLYENLVNYFANAKTYYVDQLRDNELILGFDVTFLGDFGYATANSNSIVSGTTDIYVRRTDGILPSPDYSVGQTVKIFQSSTNCGGNGPYCEFIMDSTSFLSGVTDYANAGGSANSGWIIHGNYQSIGKMGFFGIGPKALLNGITTSADGEDNGREVLTYLTDWLKPIPISVAISLVSTTTPGSVDFGIVALGATVNNSGDIEKVKVNTGPANLDVKSTVFTDGTNNWLLGVTNGSNRVKWEFAPDGNNWTIFEVAGDRYPLGSNPHASGTTQNIYLRLTMPTETNSSAQYSSTITIVATAP